MEYKIVTVNRAVQDADASTVSEALQDVISRLNLEGFEPLAITPIANQGGVTSGLIVVARSEGR